MATESTSAALPISNSGATSPDERSRSPSPSTSPSLALNAVPALDRSASTPASSTASSLSSSQSQSLSSRRLSDGLTSAATRRRGYMRPQGTSFADSARNRDSVMSLGSIAHMQYYFARTGLLDGKGAQVAREKDMKKMMTSLSGSGKENVEPQRSVSGDDSTSGTTLSLHDSAYGYAVSDPGQEHAFADSPTETTEISNFWASTTTSSSDPPMLPPTVSTYKQKPSYTEPLPDMPVLRRELKEALQDACKVLEETQKDGNSSGSQNSETESNGFYEIQGLHLLDIITLAIRAAKNYYTAHTNPQKLYALKSEREIRSDLYKVLDVLKRMASRNFRGGMRPLELTEVILWIESIDQIIKKEEQREQDEAAEREAFAWREGDWTGREREREWLFLKSFDPSPTPLPKWTEPTRATVVAESITTAAPPSDQISNIDPMSSQISTSSTDPTLPAQTTQPPQSTSSTGSSNLPTPFLKALQDGQRLVRLHNATVSKSKKNFAEIKTWHEDVAKPYRMAENLRFWIKAAELRWEVFLNFPVMDVVHGKDSGQDDDEVWRAFDEAILAWCRVVREELTEEWRVERQAERRRMPEVKVEVPQESTAVAATATAAAVDYGGDGAGNGPDAGVAVATTPGLDAEAMQEPAENAAEGGTGPTAVQVVHVEQTA